MIDRNAQQMTDISDSIYYFGELGMQEFESTKLLKETLEAAGFKVELGGAGMPTNVWAEYGSGQPEDRDRHRDRRAARRLADAGRVRAQAAGARTGPATWRATTPTAASPRSAAFAVKQVMERYNIPGHGRDLVRPGRGATGEPAVHRARRLFQGRRRGHLPAHPRHAQHRRSACGNYAAISSIFTFHGKTAHGAVNPWDGKDAVDAVELMDIGFDKLREHLRPTYRAHRTITVGGIQPNIIPDKGQIWWFVRDASMPAAKATYDKLVKIAEGAALMTGTTCDVKYAASAWPQLVNKTIAEAIQKNIDTVGMPKWTEEEQQRAATSRRPQRSRWSACAPA